MFWYDTMNDNDHEIQEKSYSQYLDPLVGYIFNNIKSSLRFFLGLLFLWTAHVVLLLTSLILYIILCSDCDPHNVWFWVLWSLMAAQNIVYIVISLIKTSLPEFTEDAVLVDDRKTRYTYDCKCAVFDIAVICLTALPFFFLLSKKKEIYGILAVASFGFLFMKQVFLLYRRYKWVQKFNHQEQTIETDPLRMRIKTTLFIH